MSAARIMSPHYLEKLVLILFSLGCVVSIHSLILVLIFPVYIFRHSVQKIGMWLNPYLTGLVNPLGNVFARDLLSTSASKSFSIATYLTDNNKTESDLTNTIENIINMKDKSAKLVFPELKHIIKQWGGYSFWMVDRTFQLKNHLTIYPSVPHSNCVNLADRILNAPFEPRRSPWEIHIVQNFYDPDFLNPEKKILVVLKVHHILLNKYLTLFSALQEGLEAGNPTQVKDYLCSGNQERKLIKFTNVFALFKKHSQLHSNETYKTLSNSIKFCNPTYEKTKPFFVDKIQNIKMKLGVSFASVIFAAVSDTLQRFNKTPRGIRGGSALVYRILPFAGQPDSLMRNRTGTQIQLPLGEYLDPMEQVLKCEEIVRGYKNPSNLFPMSYLMEILGMLPLNFCGPVYSSLPIKVKDSLGELFFESEVDRHLLVTETMVGARNVPIGFLFSLIRYEQQMRLAVTIETTAIPEDEIKILTGALADKLEILYDMLLLKATGF